MFSIEISTATRATVVFGQQLIPVIAASFRMQRESKYIVWTIVIILNIQYTHWHNQSEHGIVKTKWILKNIHTISAELFWNIPAEIMLHICVNIIIMQYIPLLFLLTNCLRLVGYDVISNQNSQSEDYSIGLNRSPIPFKSSNQAF